MKVATKAFNGVKQKMTEELVICLPNFTKPFKVECDASGFGIGGVLSHECHPIAYFSEKLNDAKQKYSTYHKYLLSPEFVIYSNHEALCYLHSQKKLNFMHGRWVEFLQRYSFVVKHRVGVENKAADELSRRASLPSVISVKVIGFEWP